jgi:cell fate (sporulation/competence/biofilm development) regulator YmcA (YheA/YmcA/DUF963 family)
MNSQDLINLAFGASASVLGWFAREMWAAVKELKSDLAKLREELPRSYVMKEDYRRDIYEIKEMLNKIFDRLDNKVDK